MTDNTYLPLSTLNSLIRGTLESAFPDPLWVVAEIAELRVNARGHCYLGLVEKAEEDVVAEMRANIWASSFRGLSERFQKATGETLKKGMQVLLLAEVSFHERYGLSLTVRDIDPSYSLGEMARKKRETIDRLRQEGLIGLNASLDMPLIPQMIAVISSSTAAGYGDFVRHLQQNPHGYTVCHKLFPSLMQGGDAEGSIIASLSAIRGSAVEFDAVVIIRGGGSQVDLSCFDSYPLAVQIARFPLPVITGIGHERDDTVADLVSHTKKKTPTDVAGFILERFEEFEENLCTLQDRLAQKVRAVLTEEGHRLKYLIQGFSHLVTGRFRNEQERLADVAHTLSSGTVRLLSGCLNRVSLASSNLKGSVRTYAERQGNKLTQYEQAVKLLDPSNVLKRGYSITSHNGRPMKRSAEVKTGDIIVTRLYEGSIQSRVEGEDG